MFSFGKIFVILLDLMYINKYCLSNSDKILGKIGKPRTSKGLATYCARIANEKIASDIIILELEKIESAPADYFVICTCDADVHLNAVANAITQKCRELGLKTPRSEGGNVSDWVLLDFFDVVVHLMLRKTREYYKLERLWGDASFYELSEEDKLIKFDRSKLKNLFVDNNLV